MIDAKYVNEKLSDILLDAGGELDSEDAVSAAISDTNATGFYADDYTCTSVREGDVENTVIAVVDYHMTGEQKEGRSFLGSTLDITAELTLENDAENWTCSFVNITKVLNPFNVDESPLT